MQIGIVGLGKMGFGFALRLREKGWEVVGFNRDPKPREELEKQGGSSAASYEEICNKLQTPRVILLSVPHDAVDEVLFGPNGLAKFLATGDVIVDAANALFENSKKHYEKLKSEGIGYLDMGVSGGPGGARSGSSIMVGGDKAVFEKVETVFKDLAADQGYAYLGPSGAGHFVKMVHNAIEYGMMQALAEGFTVLKNSPYDLDLEKIAQVYSHGSVVQSRLVEWLQGAFAAFSQDLTEVTSTVGQTGEGLWTVEEAKKLGIPIPILEGAVKFRSESEKKPSYTGKILSALRNQFGGHSVKNEKS